MGQDINDRLKAHSKLNILFKFPVIQVANWISTLDSKEDTITSNTNINKCFHAHAWFLILDRKTEVQNT